MSDQVPNNSILPTPGLGPQPTLLPENSALVTAVTAGEQPEALARQFPAESLPWALLAAEASAQGRVVEAYAYARTGYHRGLDALRKNGWRGAGPIPFSHTANQGFLRALYLLGQAAAAIGETEEAERITTFLADSDPTAAAAIAAAQGE